MLTRMTFLKPGQHWARPTLRRGTVKINEVVTDPQQDLEFARFNGTAPEERVQIMTNTSSCTLLRLDLTSPDGRSK